MIRKKDPEIIKLPEGRMDAIKARLMDNSPVLEEDKQIILCILSTYSWLQRQLQSKKLGIQRMRSLFGFRTEKHSNLKKNKSGAKDLPPDLADAASAGNALPGGNVTLVKKPLNGSLEKIMDD